MTCSSKAFSNSFLFVLIISVALLMVAARNIPTDAMLQPQFKYFDGTVLIPGIGRVMVPKKGQHPFKYNPITGAPTGGGVSVPGVGDVTGGAGSRSSIPGGDDTFLPNPAGGDIPAPSNP